MRNTWRSFFRRLATGCMVTGVTGWSSAMCYAVQLAFDSAIDPVYADGWQAGDNGGSGFQPWNFDSDAGSVGTHTIDSSSQFNNLGTAWRIANDPDITRAGRGLGPLLPGQTLRTVVDNPTETQFFKGYVIRLNAGGANICYGGSTCTPGKTPAERLGIYTFEYFTDGKWLISDLADDNFQTPLEVDETDAGMRIDVTLNTEETYTVTMTPLDNPGLAYTQSGSLGNAGMGQINWIEFLMFNTPSNPTQDTDFYIRSLEIIGAAPAVPGDYNDSGTVDAADYVVWREHSGQAFQLDNEASGVTPGMVTPEDYNAWKARFGNTSGAGAGAAVGSTAVPELGTLAYVIAGIGCAMAGGIRRTSQSYRRLRGK